MPVRAVPITKLDEATVTHKSKSVTFTYRDSGAPSRGGAYPTVFMIHGAIFHSGTFSTHLFPLTDAHNIRLICINRRSYRGSTPYDAEEVTLLTPGGDVTDAQRVDFLVTEGIYLALFVDHLIQKLELPREGAKAVLGWSLGTTFALSFMSVMDSSMDEVVKARLKDAITSVIVWDAPHITLGHYLSPDAYNPFSDPLTPSSEALGHFMIWVSTYYAHGDLSKRDYALLEQSHSDPSRPATVTASMSGLDLIQVTDVEHGLKPGASLMWEGWTSVTAEMVNRSIFSPKLAQNWPKIRRNWIWYNDSTAFPIISSAWQLQDRARGMKDCRLKFCVFEGANHMAMWDKPEETLATLVKMTSNI